MKVMNSNLDSMKHVGALEVSGILLGEDDDLGEAVVAGALPDEGHRVRDVAQLDGVVEADLVEDVLLVLCHRAHVND